jgi:hypothetical protein
MNKHIIFLTSFILYSLTTHNNFGMEIGGPERIVNRRTFQMQVRGLNLLSGAGNFVDVEYDDNDKTCTLNDIKNAISKEFNLEPNTFNVKFFGANLPENEKIPINKFTFEPIHLVIKQ